MAVHFDFIVDDIDASNIMDAIREVACRNNEHVLEIMASDMDEVLKQRYIDAFNANKEYMLSLLEKMKNTRV